MSGSRTSISGLYLPLIKYLRLIGFCPFSIKEGKHDPSDPDSNSKSVHYDFEWCSWLTLHSLIVTFSYGVASLLAAIYNLRTGFGSEFADVLRHQGIQEKVTRNLSFVSEVGTRLIPATYPFLSISGVIGLALAMPGTLQLLQRWPQFQREFLEAFPHRRDDDPFEPLRRYRNTIILIFSITSLLSTTTVAVVMLNCEYWNSCILPVAIFGRVVPTALAIFSVVIIDGSHSLHFFTFRTLMETFRQIRIGIQVCREREGQSQTDIVHMKGRRSRNMERSTNALVDNIIKWKGIVTFAKEQVGITRGSLALQHLLTILIHFVYLCLGVFSFLSSKLKLGEGDRGTLLLLSSGLQFFILIVKALSCETIVEQEKSIIAELRKVDVKGHVPSLIQLYELINLINDDPAEMRFWNVITLNKSFLLQLIGQVATYLIVLIQFDNINNCR